jgi:hypothetical protein
MTYIVIVYSNAFSFQFCASILSIMGYSVLWKCKDLGLFFLCYLPSIVRQNIFWNLPPHKTNCKLQEKTTLVQLFITQRIGEKKKKSPVFTKEKGRLSTLSEVLGACELGHELQTREGIKTYPFLCILLVPGNLGATSKPERASRPTLLSVYSWCLGTRAQPPNLEGPQDLPFFHTEHNVNRL